MIVLKSVGALTKVAFKDSEESLKYLSREPAHVKKGTSFVKENED